MDSPQPHHTLLAKTGEGWKGKSQEFFFPAIFPLPYRGNQKNPTPAAMGKPRLGNWGSAPFPPSKIWFGHTVCRRLNPYLISTSSCVQTNIKNRNSVFGKDNQSRAAHPPRKKKATKFLSPRQNNFNYIIFSGSGELFPGIWKDQGHTLRDGKAHLKPTGCTKARKSHPGKPEQLIWRRVVGKGGVRGHPCALWV